MEDHQNIEENAFSPEEKNEFLYRYRNKKQDSKISPTKEKIIKTFSFSISLIASFIFFSHSPALCGVISIGTTVLTSAFIDIISYS